MSLHDYAVDTAPLATQLHVRESDKNMDIEFVQAVDSKKTVVFSRSLDSVEGQNTRIVRTNLRDEILKLKQKQGKDILLVV
jgi:dihydrofolate reductase